jgi:hypothetical protein
VHGDRALAVTVALDVQRTLTAHLAEKGEQIGFVEGERAAEPIEHQEGDCGKLLVRLSRVRRIREAFDPGHHPPVPRSIMFPSSSAVAIAIAVAPAAAPITKPSQKSGIRIDPADDVPAG